MANIDFSNKRITPQKFKNIVNDLYKFQKTYEDRRGKRPRVTKATIERDLQELLKHPKVDRFRYYPKQKFFQIVTNEVSLKSIWDAGTGMAIVQARNNGYDSSLDEVIIPGYTISHYLRSNRTRITAVAPKQLKFGYQHPSVNFGTPFFYGNYGKYKNNLARRLELVGYFELMMQYLSTYPPDRHNVALLWLGVKENNENSTED